MTPWKKRFDAIMVEAYCQTGDDPMVVLANMVMAERALVAELKTYPIQHRAWCDTLIGPQHGCDCGLEELLK